MDIEKTVAKITGDKSLIESFKKDPIATVKKLIGDAASSDVVNGIVSGVKAKLAADDASGLAGKIKGLF